MATRTRNTRSTGAMTRPVSLLGQGGDNGPMGLMKASLGFQEISLDIPQDAKLVDIEQTLSLAISGYKRLSEASERLKPIIGRILLTVQERKLFRPEFKNFTAYVTSKVCGDMGLGRSNAFDALRIARAFPSMTAEDYQKYGATRLLLATQLTSEAEPNCKEILTSATRQTVDEFAAVVKANKQANSARVTSTVSVRVSPEVKTAWQEMLEGSELTPGELLAEMITVYSNSLQARGGRRTVTH